MLYKPYLEVVSELSLTGSVHQKDNIILSKRILSDTSEKVPGECRAYVQTTNSGRNMLRGVDYVTWNTSPSFYVRFAGRAANLHFLLIPRKVRDRMTS